MGKFFCIHLELFIFCRQEKNSFNRTTELMLKESRNYQSWLNSSIVCLHVSSSLIASCTHSHKAPCMAHTDVCIVSSQQVLLLKENSFKRNFITLHLRVKFSTYCNCWFPQVSGIDSCALAFTFPSTYRTWLLSFTPIKSVSSMLATLPLKYHILLRHP